MKRFKPLISIFLALLICLSFLNVFSALAEDNLLVQYTFENGMPQDFTPKSYDGVAAKPKVVRDSERGRVLRQYFGAGTGYGNGDPQGESYVEIAENPYSGRDISGGITFMLWCKTADNAPWDYNDTILSFNNETTRFALNNCPYLDFNINGEGSSFDIYADNQQSAKGLWKHFAFTVSPSGIKMYSNGVQISCNEQGNMQSPYAQILDFISNSGTSLNLGLGGFFGSQDCLMDDLRFYGCVLSDDEIADIYETTVDSETKNTIVVSHAGVHDPSIVTCYILEDGTQVGENDPRAAQAVDKRWWIFGSHMAVGYSDDLINWHNYASGFDENNPVINYTDDNGNKVKFTDMLTYDLGYHGSITGMWAGCSIWNPNINKWCLYGSCTSVLDDYGYNSVLWVMYSDKIEGPYKDPQPMVFTNPSFNISNSQRYIASVCPNCATYTDKSWWNNTFRTTHTVDPTAFYDKEGDLWMIYGSYNSLFILPMDENTGLPDYNESYQRELAATNAGLNNYDNNDWKSDWYWGTRINYTNYATDFTGEGTFIYYDGVTDYYYLYITYGGFAALGGYNLRVLRSQNPEGPYVDALGQDLLTYLDSDGVPVNAGVKLTGNYQWSCNSVAYMSPGHDSVLREMVDGVEKIFQMYHVRFNNKSEGFFDQLHQMVRTKDGWTIMLPYEYYGETVDYSREYSAAEIAGAYEFIDLKTTTYHIKDESKYENGSDIVLPTQQIVLSADGKIYGAASYRGGTTENFDDAGVIEQQGIIGTWSEDSGSCYADFTIGGENYTGVFTYQYDESKTRERTLVFAATGNNRTIWGSKIISNSFINKADDNTSLEKQVTVDSGVISDSSAVLYGNAAVVNDNQRGSALFLPENEEGYAVIDNPYYGKDLSAATLTFRAKVTQQADFDAAGIFMSFINSPSEWQYFTINSGLQAHIFRDGYADYYADNTPSYKLGEWHYFALTVTDDDSVEFFVDGVKIGSAVYKSDGYDSSAGNILQQLSSAEKVYLGKTEQPSGADWAWTGQECYMDNICFYSSILTPHQMLDKLVDDGLSNAVTAPESFADIYADPVVYTHGGAGEFCFKYAGNEISYGKTQYDKKTYLYIPDDFELLAISSDNGSINAEPTSKGYLLKGRVNRVNTDMALTLYLSDGDSVYKKTVYTYVLNNPLDAHVVEWNCINSNNSKRSLCHLSRLRGSTGSGGSGDFANLENPTYFNATANNASGMGFTADIGKNAGAYVYNYSSMGVINQSIKNDTVPNADYYIDKSDPNGTYSEFWDGSQYRFTWVFTTVNGNSSAIYSNGRNVYGESDNSAVTVDVSNGVYDDSPNYGGVMREYYVYGSSRVSNNIITVSMTQGSTPKASVNHRLNLTVNLVDKSLVRNALAQYEKLYENSYSSDSWDAFEAARRTVWEYMNNPSQVDDSAAVQQSYISILEHAAAELETVDYSSLQQAVSAAKALNPDSYTDDSLGKLMKYAGEYEALIGFAKSQAQIDRACEKLSDLTGKLVSAFVVSGLVTNSNGVPVENARIIGDGASVSSAFGGAYKLKLTQGSYSFTVSTDTSVDRCITFDIGSAAVTGADISIVNCDMNKDGIINVRDYSLANQQGNTDAKAEVDSLLAAGNFCPVYE